MSHLPPPPPEVPANHSMDVLAPLFHERVDQMLAMAGPDYVVFETLRTPERQEFLHGFGREYDDPEPDDRGVVTNAPTNLTSWHGYGLAVDVVHRTKGWDAPIEFWVHLGECARACGLSWGGDWKGKKRDLPHVQFGTLRDSPSDRARELMAQGGMEAVWAEVGAL